MVDRKDREDRTATTRFCWWRSRRCEFAHASSLPESSSLPATLCRRRPAGESSPLGCRTAPQPQRAAPDLEPRSKKVCTAFGSSGAWRCWRRRALVVRQSVGHVVVCAPWRMASLLGDDALIHRPTHITTHTQQHRHTRDPRGTGHSDEVDGGRCCVVGLLECGSIDRSKQALLALARGRALAHAPCQPPLAAVWDWGSIQGGRGGGGG